MHMSGAVDKVLTRGGHPGGGDNDRRLHKDRMAKLDLLLSMEQLGYRMFHAEKSYGCKFCIDVAYILETPVAS